MRTQQVIPELIKHIQTCDAAFAVGRQQIEIFLQGIKFAGLRERKTWQTENTYVKVFVDDEHVWTTEVAHNSLTPTWTFEHPVSIAAYPSSKIKFSLYRSHDIFCDNLIGHYQASCWTLLANNDGICHAESKRFTVLTMQIKLSVGVMHVADNHMPFEETTNGLSILAIQSQSRLGSSVDSCATNTPLDHLDIILATMDEISTDCGLSRAARMFLRAIHKTLMAQRNIEHAVERLLLSLHEAFIKVAACRGDFLVPEVAAMVKRAVHLAGESAEALDAWFNVGTAARFRRTTTVSLDRIETCKRQLDELKYDPIDDQGSTNGDENNSDISTILRRPCPPRGYMSTYGTRPYITLGRVPSAARSFASCTLSQTSSLPSLDEHMSTSSGVTLPDLEAPAVLSLAVDHCGPSTAVTVVAVSAEVADYEDPSSRISVGAVSSQFMDRSMFPVSCSTPQTPATPLPLYHLVDERSASSIDAVHGHSWSVNNQDGHRNMVITCTSS